MRTPRRNRYQPRLELLESRLTPAVTFQLDDVDNDGVDDDVRIVGDLKSNILVFQDDPGANTVTVTGLTGVPAQIFSAPDGTLVFDISLGAGADVITYSATGNFTDKSRYLLINQGGGADNFTLNLGANELIDSHWAVDLSGAGGTDIVGLTFGTITNSVVSLRASLAGGSEQPSVAFGSIDGSQVYGDFDLGVGNNVLNLALNDVDGAEVRIDVTGGFKALQADQVNVDLNSSVSNASQVAIFVDLLGGNDSFTGTLKSGGFNVDSNSRTELLVKGGAGKDTLTVERDAAGRHYRRVPLACSAWISRRQRR